jgi:hypothetical protein
MQNIIRKKDIFDHKGIMFNGLQELICAQETQIVGALGAAVFARERPAKLNSPKQAARA